jgi:hypothetical protein
VLQDDGYYTSLAIAKFAEYEDKHMKPWTYFGVFKTIGNVDFALTWFSYCVKEFVKETRNHMLLLVRTHESLKPFGYINLRDCLSDCMLLEGLLEWFSFFCYGSIRIISQMWPMLCILLTFSREWSAHEWSNCCLVVKWIVL